MLISEKASARLDLSIRKVLPPLSPSDESQPEGQPNPSTNQDMPKVARLMPIPKRSQPQEPTESELPTSAAEDDACASQQTPSNPTKDDILERFHQQLLEFQALVTMTKVKDKEQEYLVHRMYTLKSELDEMVAKIASSGAVPPDDQHLLESLKARSKDRHLQVDIVETNPKSILREDTEKTKELGSCSAIDLSMRNVESHYQPPQPAHGRVPTVNVIIRPSPPPAHSKKMDYNSYSYMKCTFADDKAPELPDLERIPGMALDGDLDLRMECLPQSSMDSKVKIERHDIKGTQNKESPPLRGLFIPPPITNNQIISHPPLSKPVMQDQTHREHAARSPPLPIYRGQQTDASKWIRSHIDLHRKPVRPTLASHQASHVDVRPGWRPHPPPNPIHNGLHPWLVRPLGSVPVTNSPMLPVVPLTGSITLLNTPAPRPIQANGFQSYDPRKTVHDGSTMLASLGDPREEAHPRPPFSPRYDETFFRPPEFKAPGIKAEFNNGFKDFPVTGLVPSSFGLRLADAKSHFHRVPPFPTMGPVFRPPVGFFNFISFI